MSNEIKVGILAIAAIAVSYWGYKFIMGNNILLKSNTYEVYYETVGQMQVGTEVFINGVVVGSVASIDLMNDVDRTVKVVLDLQSGLTIPKDTKAVIEATGFMGGKAVLLEYDNPCSGDDCAESGDTLEGVYKDLLPSMLDKEELANYMGIVQRGLNEILDTLTYALLSEESDSPIARSVRDLEGTLANLNSTTGQLDRVMRRSSGSIESSLDNIASITENLEDSNARISSILANADSLSGQLVAADLQQAVEEAKASIRKLNETLGTADQALGGISNLVNRLEQGQGTLGKLLQDDGLYMEIEQLTQEADSLIGDLENRPYRYIPFKTRRQINRYDRKDQEDHN